MLEVLSNTQTLGLAIAALSTVILVLYRSRRGTRNLPLPPGPKGLPILGNILQIPGEKPWKVYNDWKNIYGEPTSSLRFSVLSWLIFDSSRRYNLPRSSWPIHTNSQQSGGLLGAVGKMWAELFRSNAVHGLEIVSTTQSRGMLPCSSSSST